MLNDNQIREAIATAQVLGGKRIRLYDGAGLYLEVSPKRGIACWAFKYRAGKKERRAPIGRYPGVSLKSARREARDIRILIDGGMAPHAAKERERVESFALLADEWFRVNKKGWAERHAAGVQRYLDYAKASFGKKALADLGPADVLECLRKLEAKGKHETLRRVRLYVSMVHDYALSKGLKLGANPAEPLKRRGVLAKRPRVRSHPAMPFERVHKWLEVLEAAPFAFEVKAALRFTVLTALRTNETTGLLWGDVAKDNTKFTIPGERMKGGRDHTVFVARQGKALLDALEIVNGRDPEAHVFPGRGNEELSNGAMAMALFRTCPKGVLATVHGFRAAFSTWANSSGEDPWIVERCLAHVSADKVASAYNRSAYDGRASQLWQRWADAIAK